ncbi:MAG: BAX inhibitor (BI)-1/YccA family protein, partial [Aestuariivirgaceae bacterium]
MADLNERMVARPSARTEVIDQGLRSYMLRVYNYMAVGLGLTGLAAVATFMAAVDNGQLTSFGQLLFASGFRWVVIFAPLALVFFLSFRVHKMSVA